jgi:hypothetical protein
MTKSTFTIYDAISGNYEGFHNPTNLWNGWNNPCFNKETTIEILDQLVSTEEDIFLQYTFDGDNLVITDDYEPYTIEPTIINGVNYYSIGNFEWCWSEVTNN